MKLNPDLHAAAEILARLHGVEPSQRMDTLAFAVAGFCEVVEAYEGKWDEDWINWRAGCG